MLLINISVVSEPALTLDDNERLFMFIVKSPLSFKKTKF